MSFNWVPGHNLATKFELISKYLPDEVGSGTQLPPAEFDCGYEALCDRAISDCTNIGAYCSSFYSRTIWYYSPQYSPISAHYSYMNTKTIVQYCTTWHNTVKNKQRS